jgi:hypothetical protein
VLGQPVFLIEIVALRAPRQANGLDSAPHRHLGTLVLHPVGGERDGLESRGALPVNGRAAGRHLDSCAITIRRQREQGRRLR